jgi:hypothetical protein
MSAVTEHSPIAECGFRIADCESALFAQVRRLRESGVNGGGSGMKFGFKRQSTIRNPQSAVCLALAAAAALAG